MQADDYVVHPLRIARVELGLTQEEMAQEIGLGVSTIRRAEQWFPLNIKTQRILCDHFKKTPKELCLIGRGWTQGDGKTITPQQTAPRPPQHQPAVNAPIPLLQEAAPSPQYTPIRAIDLLAAQPNIVTDQHAGAWLALGTGHLAQLFNEGWSLENVLNSLRVVMQGAQGMSAITRRELLRLSSAAIVSDVALPTGEHVSEDEKVQVTDALGKSIANGWTLFHIASPAQVLVVSQSQLTLLQQVHTDVYPSILPMLYSGVYRLTGATLHFQGKYEQAHKAHEKAYAAALDNADLWNMGQSRSWQAYGWSAQGNYAEALRVTDAALRLIALQNDIESIRLRARLLAFEAENTALLGDEQGTETSLDTSKQLLEYLPMPHEEFDRTSWLRQAGICALYLQQNNMAAERLQQALDELPASWSLRYLSTALPLAKAYTRMRERDRALNVVQNTIPVIQSVQAGTFTKEFQSFLQNDLLKGFPGDKHCQHAIIDAQKQLAIT
jgi:DNA-binding XRE family transcriptional regulator